MIIEQKFAEKKTNFCKQILTFEIILKKIKIFEIGYQKFFKKYQNIVNFIINQCVVELHVYHKLLSH